MTTITYFNAQTSLDELPELLTVEELAAYLRCSRGTAYALVRAGKIPSFKVGQQYRIRRDSLRQFPNT